MFDKLQQIGRLKEIVKETREELKDHRVDHESSDGFIKMVLTANKRVESVDIDPQLFQQYNVDDANRLVRDAINEGLDLASEKGSNLLRERLKGHIPDIPGLDLEDFGLSV